jgi:glycosyltransferase involved in cell wall biosynthesis
MKYWLITTEFPPIFGGGISTYCWHTAKMFASFGHEITVFINDHSVSNVKKSNVSENIKLIQFNPTKLEEGKALGPEARLSFEFANIINSFMKEEGIPDVLEMQDYLGIGYYILQKKKLLYPLFKDLKTLLTMHAPNFLYAEYNQTPTYNFPRYWSGEMEKASIRMADLVISPSNYLIEELTTRMDLKEKAPIRIFNPYVNEWTKGEIPSFTNGDIVFFGKLTPQKGALEMLSYLKPMWDKGFDKSISIIGGGQHLFYPVGEDMIDHIKKMYSTYIKKGLILFEGNMAPSDLKKRLMTAHIVITPSIVDNLPYAVLEVMAMGKVVLSSSNGGHTEILENNKNGYIFDHKHKHSFEDKLKLILKSTDDELKVIGQKAQIAVEQNLNYSTVYEHKIIEIEKLIRKPPLSNTFEFIETIDIKNYSSDSLINEKGLLSIVIPFYNMGDYIDETINSLKKINYKSNEIIIINDGSTDEKSIRKLKEIERINGIKVYHKENEGLSLARNYGAYKSKGEFLAFLDADDTVSPDYHKRSIEVLNQYSNVSFVGCWAQYFGESKDVWPTFNPEPPYLLTHNMINSSALVYKKRDFLSFGLNDPSMIYGMEDYDSVISMVKNGARGVAFPELWWQYRIRKNSMAQSFTKNKELYLYRLISKKHQKFFNQYGSEIVNLLNHNGSGIYFNNPTWSLTVSGKRALWFKNSKMIWILKKNNIIRHFAKKIYRKLNK